MQSSPLASYLYCLLKLSLPTLLLCLGACRTEHSVYLNDSLEATVKKPPSGMIQLLGPDTTVRYRGRTIISAPRLYYLNFNDAVALRDDGHRGVIMVRRDGTETDLACSGTALAPDRFPGIDCWDGSTTDDFSYIRYSANGEVVKKAVAPDKLKACGRVRMGYMAYDQRGEPIVQYECMVDGARFCRSATLDDPPQVLDEVEAPTSSVDCGYLLRNQGHRPASDVQSWSLIE